MRPSLLYLGLTAGFAVIKSFLARFTHWHVVHAREIRILRTEDFRTGFRGLHSSRQVPLNTIMERIVRSIQVEGEGETLLWWKWITTVLVLLSYSVLVAMWMPIKLSGWVQAARAVTLDDEALLRALYLSSSLSTLSTTCENFLLAGEREKQGAEQVPIQGWSDGEWYYPPESSNSNSDFLQQPRMMGDSVGKHGASFSVNPAARGWLEWSSVSEKTPLQAVEGVLELKNSWDWNTSMEAVMSAEASGAKVDFNKMLAIQNLKVSLQGALVDTRAGRRIYMTGCAYRIDHSYQIDCGFQLKVTYPSREATFPSGLVQAELSRRTTGADDPLRFPTIRIHADIALAEYTSKVTYLPPVVEKKNVNYDAHLRRPSTIDAAELTKLQEDYYDDTYSGYH